MSKPLHYQIVARARAIIEDGEHWTRDVLAVAKDGTIVEPTDATAERFCAVGALTRAVAEMTANASNPDALASDVHLELLVGKGYFGTDANASCPVANHNDAEVNSVQPLSTDKTMLKRRVDKLVTSGSTAGHLGTAWAWYLLSPKWGYLFPAASAPGPYSDLTVMNTHNQPKLR